MEGLMSTKHITFAFAHHLSSPLVTLVPHFQKAHSAVTG